jgi:hypothetical protein
MASKYARWTIENPITVDRFKADLASGSIGANRVLSDVGVFAQNEMTEITKKTDASGRLTDSVTWQMVGGPFTGRASDKGSNIRGRAESDDKIDKPTTPDTVLIGSQAPHAIYRELGSGVHKSFEGHEKFEELMKEWCRTKYIRPFNPDSGDPKDKTLFLWILKGVREGHAPVPFVSPMKDKVLPFAMKRFKIAITKYLKAQGAKK